MVDNLPELFTLQYSTDLRIKLSQQGSLVRGRTLEGAHVGKQAAPVQYVAAVATRAVTGNYQPMGRVDNSYQRRWLFPQARDLPQMVDPIDLAQTINDPKSQLVTVAADACGRDWDDALFTAATGGALIGTDLGAQTTESFDPNSNSLTTAATYDDGSTYVGATVKKMLQSRQVFQHLHVPIRAERVTWVIGSQQENDLLSQVQVVSTEYNDHPVLVDGVLTRFLGYDIIVSERLNTTTHSGNTVRQTLAFVKSGLYLGIWRDMINDVDIRKDLQGMPWQLYTLHMFGASRLEPGRLQVIECLDNTGSDPMLFT